MIQSVIYHQHERALWNLSIVHAHLLLGLRSYACALDAFELQNACFYELEDLCGLQESYYSKIGKTRLDDLVYSGWRKLTLKDVDEIYD